MAYQYKIDFSRIEWKSLVAGARHKYLDQNGLRLRLIEYSKEMIPHWCEKGHCGYLIEGRMEIEYQNATIVYNPGDGIYIPDGPEHKHRGRIISDKALVFFQEQI
jgi:ethanolamine utilization protein EutQ (cupin superfamily)